MLTVTRQAVKRKLRLTGTTYDAEIDALIDEMLPAIRYAIEPSVLSNPEADLLSTLNLGALEVIAGEFSATLWREMGAGVGFRLGWLQVLPPQRYDPADPSGLKAQGWARLSPYLRREARLLYIARPKPEEDESRW